MIFMNFNHSRSLENTREAAVVKADVRGVTLPVTQVVKDDFSTIPASSFCEHSAIDAVLTPTSPRDTAGQLCRPFPTLDWILEALCKMRSQTRKDVTQVMADIEHLRRISHPLIGSKEWKKKHM